MELSHTDRGLLEALQRGLPLTHRPWSVIGARLGLGEADVLARVEQLVHAGLIKRLGVVVRHHELGYRANAMTVWDIPDPDVARLAARMLEDPAVTLCYQRPRHLPAWPYNLFCMIHGRRREDVLARIEALKDRCGLRDHPHAVLFSRRRFKQCGARYPLADAARVTRGSGVEAVHG
jgi:DNA-binding Lrp family transcriptional regulator